MSNSYSTNAGFVRRCAASLYDALLLVSLLFVASAIALWINQGEALDTMWLRGYLLFVLYVFYAWFWTHGGQTLGMRAWHMRVVDHANSTPGIQAATLRYCAMLLTWLTCGLGFAWMLFDRDRLTLHDRLSKTRVIHESSRASPVEAPRV